jgi:hypothetical protein
MINGGPVPLISQLDRIDRFLHRDKSWVLRVLQVRQYDVNRLVGSG